MSPSEPPGSQGTRPSWRRQPLVNLGLTLALLAGGALLGCASEVSGPHPADASRPPIERPWWWPGERDAGVAPDSATGDSSVDGDAARANDGGLPDAGG